MTLRIGTRASALAMTQTRQVADQLERSTGAQVELVPITSDGDRNMASLASIGGTGVFAAALREALLAGECDVVVHSLKDLPTTPLPGLTIAATPKRADARDALCARDGRTLATLPDGARVGTGSPRRRAQALAKRPDLEVVDIRGNVDTRLGRVVSADLDAVVLAAAGLDRLGRSGEVTELLELSDWPTAPGQGSLALEVRAGEEGQVSVLNHAPTRLMVEAERAVLAKLEAGCAAPVGVTASLDAGLLFVSARVYALDGTARLTSSHALYPADTKDPVAELASRIVDELLANGAADLAPLGGA
ncbi:MAG TPA: hydroxymethylbilane synthase [Microbacteriaceae bacterium]|nr:hydroxymethylbilane synthase [Microbacteriaceae bacterium]HRA09407.1 hydroxymethylbilane synthase [Microbacteriaceae bacterium]